MKTGASSSLPPLHPSAHTPPLTALLSGSRQPSRMDLLGRAAPAHTSAPPPACWWQPGPRPPSDCISAAETQFATFLWQLEDLIEMGPDGQSPRSSAARKHLLCDCCCVTVV